MTQISEMCLSVKRLVGDRMTRTSICLSILAALCITGSGHSQVGDQTGAQTELVRTIDNYDLIALRHDVLDLPLGTTRLIANGVLLSWNAQTKEAIQTLSRALQDSPPPSAKLLEEAERYLALDESLMQHYKSASALGQRFLKRQSILSGSGLRDFQDELSTWKALQGSLPMTVEQSGLSSITEVANDSGRLQATVLVDGSPTEAFFDTGADISVISRSTLTRLGVHVLLRTMRDTGSTGERTKSQIAMLPELDIGKSIVRNVPVMVEEDAALMVGTPGKQTAAEMIIGYPIMRELGSFGYDNGMLLIGGSSGGTTREGALLEVGPTVVLCGAIAGHAESFLLDTGNTKSLFTSAYIHHNGAAFADAPISSQTLAGIGGTKKADRYTLPSADIALTLGSVHLLKVSVLVRESGLDVQGLVGNIGRDLWQDSGHFRIKFSDMTIDF
jgi:predicted aspartyl protease